MKKIKCVPGRVVISCDLQGKNWHTFSDGNKIRLERQFNNLNRRETEPVNAKVIDAEHIPIDAEILIHHNSLHDINKIFNYKKVSGEDIASGIGYYSIPENECYLWRIDNNKWQPTKNFSLGLRVYQPYTGGVKNILPSKIKNALYITSGEFKGKVVRTLHGCDYEIIFQNEYGREERVIRCRHFEAEENEREEIIGVDHITTDKVANGELLIGLTRENAYKLEGVILN